MSGPVWVGAIHGRAKILNTTGTVAASGFIVDFASSAGFVTLSAEAEINVKFTTVRFEGTMAAWTPGEVRILVPRNFQTAFHAVVSRPRDFLCRTEFQKEIKHQRRGALHVFTYEGDGSSPPEKVRLQSEHRTVVIDDSVSEREGAREFRESSFGEYT